jgi:hypothetical protein
MERKPLRIVSADEMFETNPQSMSQRGMSADEFHPMYRLHEALADLNNQAVFFMSIEAATERAINELKATYGAITWKRAFEELSGYPYLTTGLKRLFNKKH